MAETSKNKGVKKVATTKKTTTAKKTAPAKKATTTKTVAKKPAAKTVAKKTEAKPVVKKPVVEEIVPEVKVEKKVTESSNENKKLMIFGIVIAALIVILIIVNVVTNGGDAKSLDEVFASEETEVVYIGRDNCSYCVKFAPQLKYLANKYSFEYTYIDTNTTSSTELNKILKRLEVNTESWGTPHTSIVKDGKVIDEIGGYVDEKTLFDKLQKNGVIASDAEYVKDETNKNNFTDAENYPSIDFIGYSEFKALYDSNARFALVLGQDGCSFCDQFKPTMEEIISEYGVKLYYIDLLALNSTEQAEVFGLITDSEFGTPTTLVVENKVAVASLGGAKAKTETVEFLKTNKIINN